MFSSLFARSAFAMNKTFSRCAKFVRQTAAAVVAAAAKHLKVKMTIAGHGADGKNSCLVLIVYIDEEEKWEVTSWKHFNFAFKFLWFASFLAHRWINDALRDIPYLPPPPRFPFPPPLFYVRIRH